MKEKIKLVFSVESDRSVLSSECRLHKTERFIKETGRLSGIDEFLSKLSEGVIEQVVAGDRLSGRESDDSTCFRLSTTDKAFSIFFKFGYQLAKNSGLKKKDIVFYKYLDNGGEIKRNDRRIEAYTRVRKTVEVALEELTDAQTGADFFKLYRLSNSDQVNFPLLNQKQKQIVETENKNVLVQGVAGSGKTNVCIDKIIFTACRAYTGRVLYSTFSRGLLIDTQSKVNSFIANLNRFISEYEKGRVIFVDADHKKAIENKVGIYFSVDDDDRICEKMKSVVEFLSNKVDYFLIEDLYVRELKGQEEVVGESYFIKEYVKDIKNHQLVGKLNRIKALSYEVIYKEIYGMIFGCYDLSAPAERLSLADYLDRRKDSFSKAECEIIYLLALDYEKHLERKGLTDNNLMCRRLLSRTSDKLYSLAVLDEVQDMTEVNLCLMKTLSRKLFCVGDALQMINPSYFSFAYLKRLLFEKDIVSVAELTNNYRNTRRIAEIIEELEKINVTRFGTHSFVVKGESVDSEVQTTTVFVRGEGFLRELAEKTFDNFTVIVSGNREKEEVRKILAKQEILTVSEIKGLERDTVVLYNILSANKDKWRHLDKLLINRKQADENSVYRYYFNLFYVGISRAKANVYAYEESGIRLFEEFFEKNFEKQTAERAAFGLLDVVGQADVEQDEILERVYQFVNLEQYDNARFAANKLTNEAEREYQNSRIEIFETLVKHGKYREAGIKFWELSRYDEAKKQFSLSGDKTLIDLVDACDVGDSKGLDVDILEFYPEVAGNAIARDLILQVVGNDYKKLLGKQTELSKKLRGLKELKNG